MPLQIDRSVRALGAVNFGPSVRSTNPLVLGADEPEVTEGVQLFVTDADGLLTTV